MLLLINYLNDQRLIPGTSNSLSCQYVENEVKINRRDVISGSVGLGLLTLAGCSSDGSEQSSADPDSKTASTSSPTETTPATTETPTASLESVDFPSGWSAQGLEDIEQARKQHKSALENTSFRRTGFEDTKQMYNARADITVDYDASNRRLLVNIDVNYRGESRSGTARTDIYVDEESRYQRTKEADGNQFSYSQSDPDYKQAFRGASNRLIGGLSLFDLTAQEAHAVQDEVEIIYDVTGLSPEGQDTRFTDEVYGDRQGNRVTITESGRLESYGVNVGAKDETEAWFEKSVEHSSLGDVTVSPPDWLGNV